MQRRNFKMPPGRSWLYEVLHREFENMMGCRWNGNRPAR